MSLARTIPVLLVLSLSSALAVAGQEDAGLKKAFERCAEISDEIAVIRGLKFTNRVAVKVQTKEEFVEYIEKEIDS